MTEPLSFAQSNEKPSSDRRGSEELAVKEYFHGKRRFYSPKENAHIIKIFAGEWYVSDKDDEMLATILGSCVSACIHDPISKIGGMNHFLLPGDENTPTDSSDAARYGVHAMESMINGMLKAGGQKHRFEVKVFGGGNVTNSSAKIGTKNAKFIRDFLKDEGFRIVAEDLEGTQPRTLRYYPTTGKAWMRKLKRKEDYAVVDEEAAYQRKISKKTTEGDVEIF